MSWLFSEENATLRRMTRGVTRSQEMMTFGSHFQIAAQTFHINLRGVGRGEQGGAVAPQS